MLTTIKKIETKIPACPFTREGCKGICCALWNDDLDTCGLSAVSLQLLMKTAVCDAAAEIMRAVEDDRR